MRANHPLQDIGPSEPLGSLYAHIPFCRERCTYCAFTTIADDRTLHAPLVAALLDECATRVRSGTFDDVELTSVYLGGGTPGILGPADLTDLVSGLRRQIRWSREAELTLEVNPSNVTPEAIACWIGLGINRLSIGIQTFHDAVLARLGRRHDAATARHALELVQSAWPHTWSADLLVGWVGQRHHELRHDLVSLLEHAPPHVSVYGLTIEPKTPLARLEALGHVVTAPSAILPAFDDVWAHALGVAGLERYEVSNFAREGHRSRHNQMYWRNASYIGLGPGASSSVHPLRWTNRADVGGYLAAANNGHGVVAMAERVEPFPRLLETISCGLRTRDGIEAAALDRRFGPGWRAVLAVGWEPLLARGILSEEAGRITIQPGQVVRLDAILRELVLTATEGRPEAGRGDLRDVES